MLALKIVLFPDVQRVQSVSRKIIHDIIVRAMPVIGWSNRTVDTSCPCKWTVSDVVAHFAELIVVFSMKTYN